MRYWRWLFGNKIPISLHELGLSGQDYGLVLRVWRAPGLVLASEEGKGIGIEVHGSGVGDSELVVGS